MEITGICTIDRYYNYVKCNIIENDIIKPYMDYSCFIMDYDSYNYNSDLLNKSNSNIIIIDDRLNDERIINERVIDESIKLLKSPEDAIKYAMSNFNKLCVIGDYDALVWFAQHKLFNTFIIYELFTFNTNNNCSIESLMKLIELTDFTHTHDCGYSIYTMTSYISDIPYIELIKDILKNDIMPNRTKYGTCSILHTSLRYSLINNIIPISTLRKVYVKSIFNELMWFINGRTDLEYLHNHNVHIWDANCTEEALLANEINITPNTVGKIYGHQWRNFASNGFDQIKFIIDSINNNPTSRRMVLSGWAPPEIFTEACLPPCHVLYHFNIRVKNNVKYLYCSMYQRSSDVVLALNWNVVSASLLMYLIGKVCNVVPMELYVTIGDAHIYENQIEAARKIINRRGYNCPKIEIAYDRIEKELAQSNDLTLEPSERIKLFKWEDIKIYNYKHGEKIYIGEMAV